MTISSLKADSSSWSGLFAPALFGVLVALFYGVHDYWLDDFEFARFVNLTADGGWSLPSVAELRSLVGERWRYDSFRLCNFLIPPFLLLPRWLTAVLMGLCWFGFISIMNRLTGLRGRFAPWAVIGLMAVVPAWWAYLPTLSSNLNYVVTLLLGAWALTVFFSRSRLSAGAAFLLGALCGWWHEGLSGPLLVGFIPVMILHPEYRSRRNIGIVVGLAVGFLILNVNPGLLYRIRLAGGAEEMYSSGAVRLVNLLWNLILPIGFLLVSLCKARSLIRTPLWQCLALIMGASLAVEAATGIVRASFLSQYISCVAIVWVLVKAWSGCPLNVKRIVAATCGLVCVATFGCAISDGIMVNRFNRAFIRASIERPGEVVFAEALMTGEGNPAAMAKAGAMFYQLPAFNYVYPVDFPTILSTRVIPATFADFEPGHNGWTRTGQGNWRRCAALVLPYDGSADDHWRRVEADVDFPLFGRVRMVVNSLPFRGSDGRAYQAVVMNEQPPYLPNPTDVRIVRERGIYSFE